jgi:hypothetical protein
MKSDEVKFIERIALGLFFGYPWCCIVDFMFYWSTDAVRPDEQRPLHGTGYVPCRECAKKSEEELLAIIAARRRCQLPFPADLDDRYCIPRKDGILRATTTPEGRQVNRHFRSILRRLPKHTAGPVLYKAMDEMFLKPSPSNSTLRRCP